MERVRLVVILGPNTGQSGTFDRFPLEIGRHNSCGFVLSDQSVSRKHARIEHVDEQFVVEDIGSRLGLIVDGSRVSRSTLSNNCRLRLGNTEVLVQLERVGSPKSSGTAPAITPTVEPAFLEIMTIAEDGGRTVKRFGSNEVSVGRAETCDLVVDDIHLSKSHFRLRRVGDRIFVQDLGSRNGTFVDNSRISTFEIIGRQEIRAGKSRFRIRVNHETSTHHAAEVAVVESTVEPPAPTMARPIGGLYQTEQCLGNIIRYLSVGPQPPLADFVHALTQHIPVCLLVDTLMLSKRLEDYGEGTVHLCDWVSQPLVDIVSPLFIPRHHSRQDDIIEELAGTGGWVGLFGKRTDEDTLKHLRAMARKNVPEPTNSEDDSPRFIALSRPDVFSAFLRFGSEEAALELLGEFEAVIMDAPDSDGGWEVYSGAGFAQILRTFGYRLQPAQTTELPAIQM